MEKSKIRDLHNALAVERPRWTEKSRYYHDDIRSFMASLVRPENSILEIGCGIGSLIGSLKCRFAVGVDISEEMIRLARQRHRSCHFVAGDAEDIPLRHTFDTVILSDTLGFLSDIQKAFEKLRGVTDKRSRILITHYNYVWEPLLNFLEAVGLKMRQPVQNWLPIRDIENLLYLSGFEIVRRGHRLLLPVRLPWVSTFFNRFLAKLPVIRRLCLVQWVIAKPVARPEGTASISCSVVVPCRDERGNIRDLVRRLPTMGKSTELIFVDGASTDGTVEEIRKTQKEYPDRNIRLIEQGKAGGKGDAVHKGLERATGDVVMILDADLTVAPEDLPKFFDALVQGKGEFINGTRLVYPMEKQGMRFLNRVANQCFGILFTYLLEQRFTDTLCGTKALWRRDYEKIRRGGDYFGNFDPFGDYDLIFGAARQNLKMVELPVRYRERTYGRTKIKRFFHGWLLLKMSWIAMKKLKFV